MSITTSTITIAYECRSERPRPPRRASLRSADSYGVRRTIPYEAADVDAAGPLFRLSASRNSRLGLKRVQVGGFGRWAGWPAPENVPRPGARRQTPAVMTAPRRPVQQSWRALGSR